MENTDPPKDKSGAAGLAAARSRQSNVELLRILATFFILVVHANFLAFGAPSGEEVAASPVRSFLRFLVQAVASAGVDAFVLISGWFGIRPSRNRLSALAFQSLFFAAGLYAVGLSLGLEVSAKEAFLDLFMLSHWNWFLRAYLGLVVLAPVLNAYADGREEKEFRFELIAFFAVQTVWGWIARDTQSFRDGKSIVSFVGLYLLARYVRLQKPVWSLRTPWRDFAFYAILSLFIAVSGLSAARIGWKAGVGTLYSDSSPFVVASALFLFLGFTKIPFRSSWVNRIAKSSFASYLVHTHPCVLAPFFIPVLHRMISSGTGGWACSACFLVGVFGVSVLLDQIRILFWMPFRCIASGTGTSPAP